MRVSVDDGFLAPIVGSRFEDPAYANKIRVGTRKAKVPLLTSQYVSFAVNIKDGDTGKINPITFKERKYLLRPYDTNARRVLLFTSRQTEKSTTLGNRLLALSGMRDGYTSLYVSPSAMQTSVFSKTRLADVIDISPVVKGLTNTKLTNNILEREFINKSKIYLRYSFLTADRIRGLSVNAIFADEIQDLLIRNMPVIEETASHHQGSLFVYSGTPKTYDNTIEKYWSSASTQSEWVIPCRKHGTPNNRSSWHWVVLDEKNIGKKGPICDKCGGLLNVDDPECHWVEMNPGAEFEGYRICRLMVPWFAKTEKWSEILDAYERYPKAQFYNEVLARSYDSGMKPITRTELIQACDETVLNDEEAVAQLGQSHRLWAGIDWGGDGAHGTSFTVLSILGYTRPDGELQVLYLRRFDGPFQDPLKALEEIKRLLYKFRVHRIGADYGMGLYANDTLIREFGPHRVHKIMYAQRLTSKMRYSPQLGRYMAFRTEVMSDIFNAMKRKKIRLPRWENIREPYGSDILSIFSEYSETLRMIKYDKPQGITDDTLHSIVFGVLASMLDVRRRDIIRPLKETSQATQLSQAETQALDSVEYMAHF